MKIKFSQQILGSIYNTAALRIDKCGVKSFVTHAVSIQRPYKKCGAKLVTPAALIGVISATAGLKED